MQTVLHLAPRPPPPTEKKNIEESKYFVQNRKKPREIDYLKKKKKKKKKKKRFWDNVLVSCKQSVGQIVVVFFPDFSRVLSVLDKIFRFLDVFLILDRFF